MFLLISPSLVCFFRFLQRTVHSTLWCTWLALCTLLHPPMGHGEKMKLTIFCSWRRTKNWQCDSTGSFQLSIKKILLLRVQFFCNLGMKSRTYISWNAMNFQILLRRWKMKVQESPHGLSLWQSHFFQCGGTTFTILTRSKTTQKSPDFIEMANAQNMN